MTFTIFYKELKSLLKNKRLLFNLFILPPLLIFFIMKFTTKTEITKYQKGQILYIAKADSTIVELLKKHNIQTVNITDDAIDTIIKESPVLVGENGNYQFIYTVFSENKTFIKQIKDIINEENLNYFSHKYKEAPPYSITFVNKSNMADTIKYALGMFIPFLIIVYLVIGSSAVGNDTFAGEKERHTLSLLLTQPIKRYEIFTGKLFFTSLVALSYTVIISLSVIYPVISTITDTGVSIALSDTFSLSQIMQFILYISTLSIMIGSMVLGLSLFSRSVKESQSMIVFLILIPIIMQQSSSNIVKYIPFVNGPYIIKNILFSSITWQEIIIASILNIVGILLFILVGLYMFKKEEILFRT